MNHCESEGCALRIRATERDDALDPMQGAWPPNLSRSANTASTPSLSIVPTKQLLLHTLPQHKVLTPFEGDRERESLCSQI